MAPDSLLLWRKPENPVWIRAASVFVSTVTLALSGCGLTVTNPALFNGTSATTSSPGTSSQIHGHVGNSQSSISASSVQLYSMGTQGMGSAATPLLSTPVTTDSSGNFTISESYACSSSSRLYLVATGGNPGLAGGTNNQALALMTILGACGSIASTIVYPVNEVTTVGSVWPLASYMTSATQLGSSTTDTSFTSAMTRIGQLINLVNGASPGTGIPSGYAVQTAKLDTLAGDLHACVASRGGDAGDGSACGQLFSLTTAQGKTPPNDTIAAALSLAQSNQLSVDGLFQFLPANGPFQPVLPEAPTDWNLDLVQIPAAPAITPASGVYTSGQSIAISSNTAGAALHYTLDGSVPGAGSPLYTSPLALTTTETVRAIAVTDDIGSAVSSATFDVSAPVGAVVSVAVAPSQVSLSPAQTQQFTAAVSGAANASVTWTLNPAVGSISAAGLYTAPSSIPSSQTVTVTASSVADPTKTASATIALGSQPVVAVGVAPGSVTLAPSQAQQFTATVTGTGNAAVAWAVSPATGSISASGLYTAPSSIVGVQTVTVSATSRADPTKVASATITLSSLPVVAVEITPGNVTLAPAQTQQFTATVTGTSNAAVTWAVSPVVGNISASGVYTAPTAIAGLQTITVTATSAADITKTASATVSITPEGSAYLTYYVDNVNGSDANAGTSAAAPLATIARVNTLNLQPGQTVAFKAGDVWHEMLTVSQSGSSGLPINYTSYGTGAQPVIDASDTVTGWTQAGSGAFASLPSYVWTHPQTTDPLLINFAGQTGNPAASSTNISAPLQFAWDGSTLYVYSNSDPTPIVEIAARPSALTSAGASYVKVSGLELRGGTDVVYCGGSHPCTNWDFESNTIDSGHGVGLRWIPSPGVSGANLTVNNNTFRGTGGAGIGISNGGSALGDVVTGNTLTDLCKIYIAGSSENAFCDAINLYSQTGNDGGGSVVNNSISQVGLTSGAPYGGGIHADTVINWDIEHNYVVNTNYPGVELEKGSGSVVRYNLLVNTGQHQYFGGLFIRAGDGLSVSDMTAQYNTVVGGYWACALGITQSSGAVTATNITLAKNICTGSSGGTQLWLDPGYTGAGNSFIGNGFGIAKADFVTAADVSFGSYQLLPSPLIDSISGDPQFINPTAGDYHLQSTSPDLTIGAFAQP